MAALIKAPLARLFSDSLLAWSDDRCARKGAALAFCLLFALVPGALTVIAGAGRFFPDDALQEQFVVQVEALTGTGGARAVEAMLSSADESLAAVIGSASAGLLLALGLTLIFAEMKRRLDKLWGIEVADRSLFGAIGKPLRSAVGLSLAFAFLLVASLLLSAAVAALGRPPDGLAGGMRNVFPLVRAVAIYGLTALLFALIYKALPEAGLAWQDVSGGALVAAALLALGKALIGACVGRIGGGTGLGNVTALIALLLWVYWSAEVFLLGAEFTRRYALCRGSRQPGKRLPALEDPTLPARRKRRAEGDGR